jgi:hypothetical protein
MLSEPLRSEPRLTITAVVNLTLDAESESLAQRQERSERQLIALEHDESVRIDLLRTRLLDPHLGLVAWLDRHTDSLWSPDAPGDRATAALASFEAIRTALLRRGNGPEQAGTALVRARVDELLATLEDPTTADRAAGVLEQLVQVIHGESRSHAAVS